MRNYIIDTNVLLQDPEAIFSFGNNVVIIPIGVIEELDTFKKDTGELGRNSRQVSRSLDLFRRAGDLRGGVEMENGGIVRVIYNGNLGTYKKEKDVDYHVLHIAQVIKDGEPEKEAVVISRDINVRLKANALGIKSQDYESGMVCEKFLDSGHIEIKPSKEAYAKLFLKSECVVGDMFDEDFRPYPNYYIMVKPTNSKDKNLLARTTRNSVCIKRVDEFPKELKIKPKNKEQAFAMDALLDPSISLVSLVGMAGTGKAQPLECDVLTPSGFEKMGDLKVGQYVLTPDGKKAKVASIHPQGNIPVYRVNMSDGSCTECCADHLWKTKTKDGEWSVKSTKKIIETIKDNHEIPMVNELKFQETDLEIDPYVLGAAIGRGLKKVGGMKKELKEMGLYDKEKWELFIPNHYKISSMESRLSLVKGLVSSSESGSLFQFFSESLTLIRDLKFVVESLGGQGIIIQVGSGFTLAMNSPWLKRGRKTLPEISRKIVEITHIGEKEAQCIYIDSDDHLYVTDSFIVTHNTLLATAAAEYLVDGCSMYEKTLISRPIQPTGKDIGYLPGSVEEKMDPWMTPIYDALEIIHSSNNKKITGRKIVEMSDKIFIEPLTYIRGRSIHNHFFILDEAQNLTALEAKTIITRAGENTKIVLTGDIDQIDNPYLDRRTNGLSVVLDAFADSKCAAHIMMKDGVRSELSEEAAKRL